MNKKNYIVVGLIVLGIILVSILTLKTKTTTIDNENRNTVNSDELENKGYKLVNLEPINLEECDDLIPNEDTTKDYKYSFYTLNVEGHIKENRIVEINGKDIGHKIKTMIRDEYEIYLVTMDDYLYFANENKLISNSKIKSIFSFNKEGIEYYQVLFEDGSNYEFSLD